MPDPLVVLDRVSKTYRRGGATVTAVDDVSLEVATGEIVGVIGYSGAGKSTLVRLINALERPTSGRVVVGGRELTALPEREVRLARRDIGMIFQQFNLMRSRTAAGNVEYPLRLAGMPRERREARVAELLDFVGLLELAHAHPEQLSGGQKQRVGIARALATDPALLLADEATSALDPETTVGVLDLLRRVNRDLGITIVVITHEMEVVRAIGDRVAVMDAGRVVEHGDAYRVFSRPESESAARFVRGAVHARPSADTLERLRARHPGALVGIGVDDRAGFHAGIGAAVRAHGVAAEVVYGGITEIQERALGHLTYELSGDRAAIDGTLAALRAAGYETDEYAEGAPR